MSLISIFLCNNPKRYLISVLFPIDYTIDYLLFHNSTLNSQLLNKPCSRVSSVLPPVLASICFANRVQQSHCSSIVHRVLLTHALAFSSSQFVHEKKSPRICTSMHTGGNHELTYTRLEDNLIRHRERPAISYIVTTTVLYTHLLCCVIYTRLSYSRICFVYIGRVLVVALFFRSAWNLTLPRYTTPPPEST